MFQVVIVSSGGIGVEAAGEQIVLYLQAAV
jgi:hypothetical protein